MKNQQSMMLEKKLITDKKLTVLRLFNSPGPTSAPFNQFSLGLKSDVDQVLLSLFPPSGSFDHGLDLRHANGSFFMMLKLIKKAIWETDFDVIHVHSGHAGLALLLGMFPASLKLRKRVIFTLHTSFHLLSARNKVLVLLTILLFGTTCPCSASSEKSLPLIIRILCKSKIKVVMNGFDNFRLDGVKEAANSEDVYNNASAFKVLVAGALNNNKNQISVLRGIEGVNELCELVFLGDGPNRKRLEQISEKILNRNLTIVFKGKVPRELAMRYMLDADIFISGSKGEGMPISVLEALYSKCVTILSEIPPHQEIVEMVNASPVVDFEQTEAVTDSIHNAFRRSVSSSLYCDQIQENVKKHFGLRVMLNKYMELYDDVGGKLNQDKSLLDI